MNILIYKYTIFIIVILNIKFIQSKNSPKSGKSGYIAPSAEQNYKNLLSISNGIATFKFPFANRQELVVKSVFDTSLDTQRTNMKNDASTIGTEELSTQLSPEKSEFEKTKDGKSSQIKSKSKKDFDLMEKERKKNDYDRDMNRQKDKSELIKDKSEFKGNKDSQKEVCKAYLGSKFPFKPFAETARAVGIPAHSFHKNSKNIDISFEGILDSSTLLEIFYFDYDKIHLNRPLVQDDNNSWISRSLLSLIYRSDNEDPLSFLMLSYGIVNAHWENYSLQSDIDTPELVVEDIDEYDTTRSDIIYK